MKILKFRGMLTRLTVIIINIITPILHQYFLNTSLGPIFGQSV